VLERSLIGGAELTHRVDLDDPNQLIAVVRKLQAQDLIEVSGDVLNETRFPYAMIGIRPSAKEYLYSILKQQV